MELCILLDARSAAGPENHTGGALECRGKRGKRITGKLDGSSVKVALELETPSSLEMYESRSLALVVCLAKGSILKFAYEGKSKGGKGSILLSPVALGENRKGPL